MNQTAIFKSVHAMINEQCLVKLTTMTNQELQQVGTTHTSLKKICERLEIDIEYLFFDPENIVYPVCYWDGLFYYCFISLSENIIFNNTTDDTPFNFAIENQFKNMKQMMYETIKKQNWSAVLNYADKKTCFLVFNHLRDRIPEEKQKELFITTYTRNEYGFNKLNPQTVQDVLKLPTPDEYDIFQSDVEIPESGLLTIYRGMTPESTPIDNAYSWTLSLDTARFFAHRFNSRGDIYQAIVHAQDIRAYITGRSESEVLVFPKDVRNATKI